MSNRKQVPDGVFFLHVVFIASIDCSSDKEVENIIPEVSLTMTTVPTSLSASGRNLKMMSTHRHGPMRLDASVAAGLATWR